MKISRQRFDFKDATDINLARSRKFTRRSPNSSVTFDEADAFTAAHDGNVVRAT